MKAMMKFAISAHLQQNGKITYEYIEIPVSQYENWLKKCYELSGIF